LVPFSYELRECALDAFIQGLLAWLASPGVGLPAVFIVSLLAATILPVGSEPVLLGYLAAVPEMFWWAIIVATLGNTLGGVISYAMGTGAHGLFGRWRARRRKVEATTLETEPVPVLTPARARAERWVHRFGAPVLLLAWLPIVGDPLCAVAGWLRLPFWPCVVYMAVGKLGRYLTLAWALAWAIAPT
jgi:membrane protein YqaA with SNARE-associated domain